MGSLNSDFLLNMNTYLYLLSRCKYKINRYVNLDIICIYIYFYSLFGGVLNVIYSHPNTLKEWTAGDVWYTPFQTQESVALHDVYRNHPTFYAL